MFEVGDYVVSYGNVMLSAREKWVRWVVEGSGAGNYFITIAKLDTLVRIYGRKDDHVKVVKFKSLQFSIKMEFNPIV